MINDFRFRVPGELKDGDLRLVLAEKGFKPTDRPLFPFYKFEMRRVGEDSLMGWITLRIGDAATVLKYPGHLGFDVEPEYRGCRYAARSVRLVLPFARQQGLCRVWIGCPPDNLASRRTCELAGGICYETVTVPEESDLYQQGIRLLCRYYIDN